MKVVLMTLPFVCAAAGALAQEVEPQGAARAETTQALEKIQAPAVPGKETGQDTRRQGADMRHCLELKDSRGIIRCAEPGRRP